MLLQSPNLDDGDAAVRAWYDDSGNQRTTIFGLNLLVVSSIAFVWFVAVIRRRVGSRENRFFGTVFFGSALLLSGAWLTAGVLAATPAIAAQSFDVVPDTGATAALRAAALGMASVVATRLEAVFIISATTVGRLSGAFPRWLVIVGYTVGLALMLVPVPNTVSIFVFPCWVAAASVLLLVRRDDVGIPVGGGLVEPVDDRR